jgi:hypothetical protein
MIGQSLKSLVCRIESFLGAFPAVMLPVRFLR